MSAVKRAFALLATALVALLVPIRTEAAPSLQPGDVMINTVDQLCTLGFVVDGSGGPYFLTAAHCARRVGERIVDGDGNLIGTVAAIGNAEASETDWALIEVTSSGRAVSSIVRGHTAPTGVATVDRANLGDVLSYSGHGIPWSITNVLREQRIGLLMYQDGELWTSAGLNTFGDSGGPVIHRESGAALGLVSRLCVGACEAEGPTIEGILTQAAAYVGGISLRTG